MTGSNHGSGEGVPTGAPAAAFTPDPVCGACGELLDGPHQCDLADDDPGGRGYGEPEPATIVDTPDQMAAAVQTPGRYRVHLPGLDRELFNRAVTLVRRAIEAHGLRAVTVVGGDLLFFDVLPAADEAGEVPS